ncbi:hypothetical protein EMPG_09278 [Blastomyces silverae]|uniref:Uncharacterized protein n=1 Tax=Blastomyces silverae TaxID=2060906 RepID=A0A0H1B4I7_9EURO|nr:hypothetical protein EMPG_09278 [Blastomyces silverae]
MILMSGTLPSKMVLNIMIRLELTLRSQFEIRSPCVNTNIKKVILLLLQYYIKTTLQELIHGASSDSKLLIYVMQKAMAEQLGDELEVPFYDDDLSVNAKEKIVRDLRVGKVSTVIAMSGDGSPSLSISIVTVSSWKCLINKHPSSALATYFTGDTCLTLIMSQYLNEIETVCGDDHQCFVCEGSFTPKHITHHIEREQNGEIIDHPTFCSLTRIPPPVSASSPSPISLSTSAAVAVADDTAVAVAVADDADDYDDDDAVAAAVLSSPSNISPILIQAYVMHMKGFVTNCIYCVLARQKNHHSAQICLFSSQHSSVTDSQIAYMCGQIRNARNLSNNCLHYKCFLPISGFHSMKFSYNNKCQFDMLAVRVLLHAHEIEHYHFLFDDVADIPIDHAFFKLFNKFAAQPCSDPSLCQFNIKCVNMLTHILYIICCLLDAPSG